MVQFTPQVVVVFLVDIKPTFQASCITLTFWWLLQYLIFSGSTQEQFLQSQLSLYPYPWPLVWLNFGSSWPILSPWFNVMMNICMVTPTQPWSPVPDNWDLIGDNSVLLWTEHCSCLNEHHTTDLNSTAQPIKPQLLDRLCLCRRLLKTQCILFFFQHSISNHRFVHSILQISH